MMKVLLSVGVYLSLVVALGFVLAWMAPREALENDFDDEDAS